MRILWIAFLPLFVLAKFDPSIFYPSSRSVASDFSIHSDKKIYKSGEIAKFTINTKGKKGYLYLFATFGDNLVVLLPNYYYPKTQYVEGKFEFPKYFKELDRVFEYETSNDSKHPKELTKFIAIISEKELSIEYNYNKREIFKALKHNTPQAKKLMEHFKGIKVRGKNQNIAIHSASVNFDVVK
ncbi:MAG: hypothetical protein U9N49_06500 [Campylobacterota bacterium]|nr:hypothetical protein [Campylobacterota bacterium]